MKVVLIIIGIALLLLIALVGGGYFWFDKNKDEYANLMKEYIALGEQYGHDKAQSHCFNGLMKNMEVCDGLMRCQFASVGFIRGCMTAASNDQYCDHVPRREEFLKSVSWSIASCDNQKIDSDTCQRYVRGFVEICEQIRQETSATPEPAAPALRAPSE